MATFVLTNESNDRSIDPVDHLPTINQSVQHNKQSEIIIFLKEEKLTIIRETRRR